MTSRGRPTTFSVRGELTTHRLRWRGGIKIRQNPAPTAKKAAFQPFKIAGSRAKFPGAPASLFVSLDLRRQGSHLCTER